jgi:hypothetical protein
MLFPLFPRRPQRFVRFGSALSPPSVVAMLFLPGSAGLGGPTWTGVGLPPRMAETDECGERACLWMAEVMDMHSEITSDTGSTETDTGRLRYCILAGTTDEPGRRRDSGLEMPAAGSA